MSGQINLFNPIFLKTKKVFSAVALIQAFGLVLFGAILVLIYAAYQSKELSKNADIVTAQLHAAEGEHALVLQEELAFFREEQAEAREVHLLLVGLHLREVGVVGEVGREVRRDAVLRIDADIGAGIVRFLCGRHVVGRQVGNGVGLQLDRA